MTIETSLEHQQYTLAAFLDIEGAFNNVRVDAIVDSLSKLGVDVCITNWIKVMLVSRVIHSTIGSDTTSRSVNRGTPQGGVISPLLWLLVVNDILLKIESMRIKAVAYADDVVILSSRLFTTTISEPIGWLKSLANWTSNCGLGVNPDKTELVLFTRKNKIQPFRPPRLLGYIISGSIVLMLALIPLILISVSL